MSQLISTTARQLRPEPATYKTAKLMIGGDPSTQAPIPSGYVLAVVSGFTGSVKAMYSGFYCSRCTSLHLTV